MSVDNDASFGVRLVLIVTNGDSRAARDSIFESDKADIRIRHGVCHRPKSHLVFLVWELMAVYAQLLVYSPNPKGS